MARYYSRSRRSRKGRRHSIAFLASVTGIFLVVVLFMFRGGSSGPKEAAAGDVNAAASSAPESQRGAPQLAVTETSRSDSDPAPQTLAPDPESLGMPIQTTPAPVAAGVQPQAERTEPEVAPDARVETIIAEGNALLQKRPQQIIAARDKLNEALSLPMSPNQRLQVKGKLAELSEQWLFGPAAFPGDDFCKTYTVQRGDLLQTIGGRNKVPYEIIMRINNIARPEALQAGRTIKIPNGPFHVKVYRSTFTMDLYLQDTYVRSFKVGLGKPGYDTPTGLWCVREGGKQISPPWSDPDVQGRVLKATHPDYPLGSRWIGLKGVGGAALGRTGFGIHGTKDPGEIGKAVSRGCIRLYNGQVILVYDCLVPSYSRVEVLD